MQLVGKGIHFFTDLHLFIYLFIYLLWPDYDMAKSQLLKQNTPPMFNHLKVNEL